MKPGDAGLLDSTCSLELKLSSRVPTSASSCHARAQTSPVSHAAQPRTGAPEPHAAHQLEPTRPTTHDPLFPTRLHLGPHDCLTGRGTCLQRTMKSTGAAWPSKPSARVCGSVSIRGVLPSRSARARDDRGAKWLISAKF